MNNSPDTAATIRQVANAEKVFKIVVDSVTAAVKVVNDPNRLAVSTIKFPTPLDAMGEFSVVVIGGQPMKYPMDAVRIAVAESDYPPVAALTKAVSAYLYPIRRACGAEAYEAAVAVMKEQGKQFVEASDLGKWATVFVYPDEPQVQHTSPCKECAFVRTIEPGALGGSSPETYIGQCHGPYVVPCHLRHNCDNDEARRNPNNAQCAGVAVFRANTGRADELLQLMPPHIREKFLWLPKDTEHVFATNAEFLAHHKQITLEEAEKELAETPPEVLLQIELRRPGAQNITGQTPPPNVRK